MFTGIGAVEILLIAAALLLLFGARRIPEIARGLGSGIRNFKGSLHAGESDDQEPERSSDPGSEGPASPREGTPGDDAGGEPGGR